jgi:uncharacterized protein YecE (DUF72 family)
MSDLFYGTAGWSFDDWTGPFYPPSAAKKPLAWYSDWFDCAEVNATFYRPPEPRLAAGWVKQVEGKRFVFPVKVSQELTHDPKARVARAGAASVEEWGRAEARSFLAGVAPLEAAKRLGPLLLQFPWSFRNSAAARDRIARLAEWFEGKPLVVELRHASWDRDEARGWLRELGLGWVNVDQPALKDCIGPGEHATSDVAYVRLHGRRKDVWFSRDIEPHERYDYLYTKEELEPWAERVKRMMARAKTLYVIGNNHYRGKAPANTLQLKAMVSGKKVAVPETLLAAYPALRDIAAPPKGRLF